MNHQLHIIAGPEQGRKFTLEDGQTLTIGRGQASDTKLNDPRMSRVHCAVSVDGGTVTVADRGSSSGTFVGGEKIESRALAPGEVFEAGDSQIRYLLDGGTDETTLVGDAGKMFGREKPKPKVAPLNELVGQTLDRFRLDAIITQGRTGMVFEATDTKQDRPAAVKVLSPESAGSDEQKQRFIRAMKTMIDIRHANLVELYGAGKKGPYCWAAMEYVDGESLDKVIDRIGTAGMLDWKDAFLVGFHVGQALIEAESRRIIHRNVTPQNILRRNSDKVSKLGDLMLAKALEGANAQPVTSPGQMIGDLPYMAPERTRDAAEVDCRSDLYGLGATLYALLTGRPPHEGDSLPELVRKVRKETPPPIKQFQLSVPELMQDTVMLLLSKRPDDRPASARDFVRDLTRIAKFNGISV